MVAAEDIAYYSMLIGGAYLCSMGPSESGSQGGFGKFMLIVGVGTGFYAISNLFGRYLRLGFI